MEKETLVIIVGYTVTLDLGVHSDSGLTGVLLVYLDHQFGGRQDILLYWVGGEDLGYTI